MFFLIKIVSNLYLPLPTNWILNNDQYAGRKLRALVEPLINIESDNSIQHKVPVISIELDNSPEGDMSKEVCF